MNKSLIAGLLLVFLLSSCTTGTKYVLRNPQNNNVVICGETVTIHDIDALQCVMKYTGQGYKIIDKKN